MNAEEFLSLAGKLVVPRNASEAACRTAISRAYYACFHAAKDFVVELGFRITRDHAVPQRMLMSSDVEASLRVGRRLANLQSERIHADYELGATRMIDVETARLSVERAHEILTLLAECRKEPARSLIKSDIENYQRKIASPGGS